jgi:hypothetical protein
MEYHERRHYVMAMTFSFRFSFFLLFWGFQITNKQNPVSVIFIFVYFYILFTSTTHHTQSPYGATRGI